MAAQSPHNAALRLARSALPVGEAWRLSTRDLFGLVESPGIAFVAFDFGTETILIPRKAIAGPARDLSAERWRLSAFVTLDGLRYQWKTHGRLTFRGARVDSAELAPSPDTLRITFGESPEAAAGRLAAEAREAALREMLARVDETETGRKSFCAVLDGWTLATQGEFMIATREDLGPMPEENRAPVDFLPDFRRYLASFDRVELRACDLAKLPRALRGAKSANKRQFIAFAQGERDRFVDASLLARAVRGLDLKATRVGLDDDADGPVLLDGGDRRAIIMPMRASHVDETKIRLWLALR